MKPQQRWLLLGGLLLASLLAAYFAEDEAPAAKTRSRGAAKTAHQAASGAAGKRSLPPVEQATAAPLEFPESAAVVEDAAEGIDPFRSKTWFIPPPPPPPVKSTAPPLPFQFLGRLVEAGESRVFLNHQGRYLIVKAGDAINGSYTVEEIGGGRVTFLYRPLNQRQTLSIGSDGDLLPLPPAAPRPAGAGSRLSLMAPAEVDMGISFKVAVLLAGYAGADGGVVEFAYDKNKIDAPPGGGRATLLLRPAADGGLQGSTQFTAQANETGETVLRPLSVTIEEHGGAMVKLPPPPPHAIRINP